MEFLNLIPLGLCSFGHASTRDLSSYVHGWSLIIIFNIFSTRYSVWATPVFMQAFPYHSLIRDAIPLLEFAISEHLLHRSFSRRLICGTGYNMIPLVLLGLTRLCFVLLSIHLLVFIFFSYMCIIIFGILCCLLWCLRLLSLQDCTFAKSDDADFSGLRTFSRVISLRSLLQLCRILFKLLAPLFNIEHRLLLQHLKEATREFVVSLRSCSFSTSTTKDIGKSWTSLVFTCGPFVSSLFSLLGYNYLQYRFSHREINTARNHFLEA